MLGVLLLFTVISVVYGQTQTEVQIQALCTEFSTYQDDGLQEKLDGTFFNVYTSAAAFDCEKDTFVTDANGVTTGYIESPDCCVEMYDFDFTLNQLNYTIGPVPGYANSCGAITTQYGAMKLLATTGSGNSLCLIVSVCQPSVGTFAGYAGMSVMCRQPSAPLLIDLFAVLQNVVGLLQAILLVFNGILQPVSQTGCDFPINNCPAV